MARDRRSLRGGLPAAPEKTTSDDHRDRRSSRKVAPGTRYFRYRCSLPGLAGFTAFASPGTINNTRKQVVAAEGEGFEPSVPFSTHDFQSCTFGHSVTPPMGLVAVAA